MEENRPLQNHRPNLSQLVTVVPSLIRYKLVVFGLILLIAVAVGAYFLGLKNSSTVNPDNNIVISITPTPQTPKNIYQNTYSCQADSDCKLIYSNCGCEAVDINDLRTKSDKDNDKVCKMNECSGVALPARAVCVNNTCQVANWNQLIMQRKAGIINKSGTVAVDIRPLKSELFYKDVYIVSWSFINPQGNQIATEGGYGLVGPVNNQFQLSLPSESQYCQWLKASDKDGATKAFMGIEECR